MAPVRDIWTATAALFLSCFAAVTNCPSASAADEDPGTAVLTRSYDNGRTGANLTETQFTPAVVVSKGLTRVRSFQVDDDLRIEAQPLYVPGIQMPDGKKHNILFVASMGNHVWAFDVDGSGVWKTPALGMPFDPPENEQPGQHRSTTIDGWGINIDWGILSTPVIDLDESRMYLVNWMTQETPPGPPQRSLFAHRIDLSTMQEIGNPTPIQGTLTDEQGKPVLDARGKPVVLQPDQKQRAALLLVPLRGAHKTLFVATTGGEHPGDPHGWIVALDVDSFTQTAAWVSTPSGFGGGIWQASQGLAADSEGNVYAMTGNGGYAQFPNGNIRDFNGTTDFAEAVVRLKYEKTGQGQAKLSLDDWFIPFRDSDRVTFTNYDYRDQDLSASGPVLPSDNDLLLGGGKDGLLYILDRHQLGKCVVKPASPGMQSSMAEMPAPDPRLRECDLTVLKSPPIYVTYNGVGLATIVPHIDFPLGNPTLNPSKTHHLHGSPVYWNGSNGPMVFVWGENESLRAWRLNPETGALSFIAKGAEVASAALAAAPTGMGGMPGGMLSLSSNGKNPNTGIVWALAPIDGDANHDVVDGIARAYDATNLDPTPIDPQTPRLKLLWDSTRSGVTFKHAKFTPPVVADGRLFVPTYDGRVDMYMLAP
jgi:outer membrane protein assembly factor BamB